MKKIFLSISIIFLLFPNSVQAQTNSSFTYVTNTSPSSNNVSVIDINTNNIVTTIPVGNQPRGIAAHSATHRVYVANTYGHSISVINSLTNTVIATIPVVGYPLGISVNNDGSRVYAADFGPDNTISVINTATNTVMTTLIGFSNPQNLVENSTGTRFYVANSNCCSGTSGFISVMDVTNNYALLTTIPVGIESNNLTLAPDNSKLYVVNNGGSSLGNTLSVIDTNTNTVSKTITVGINPMGIDINSTGTRVYVSSTYYWSSGGTANGTVAVIDTATDSVIATVPVGSIPNSLAISPDDSKIYVANTGNGSGNTVSVIDAATNTVINTIIVGTSPWGVATIQNPTPSTSLSVPLLKQTAEPWQGDVYDSANLWSPANPTINRWGCAMTSAAMVFKYHGLNKLPDGTALDPGTLNAWLKGQKDGYIREGWVNWLALSRLSKLARNINGVSFDALEYKRKNGADKTQLTEDITNGIPDILEEPGHFIVGKGINGDTFTINDPFYDRANLNEGYANTFVSMGRYIPSHTDLSYIMVVADANVTIKLLNNAGTEVATSFIQQPISDPLNPTKHNAPVSILYAPQPASGDYQIVASGNENTIAQITTYTYDNAGEVSLVNNQISGNASLTLSFDKNKSTNSTVKKSVTFESTLEDIKELRELDLLHFSEALSITALVKNAEMLHNKEKDDQAEKLLDVFIKQIETSPKRFADPVAKEILLYDFQQLKAFLHQ